MQRLTAYCRRTVLAAAREYAHPAKRRTAESTKAAFRDAMQGTDTGWWNDLIYTAPMLDMANRYRADIAATVREFVEMEGCVRWSDHADRDREFTWADVLAATARRVTWEDYQGDNGRDKETAAMALHWGLRFAVEYLTGNLAREYAPDL
jgi:hypothetical protein